MTGMVQVPFGNTFVTRIAPAGPAQHYKTYGASLPLATHWVSATCEQIDCEPFLKGWSINVAPLSEQDRDVIRNAGYRYIELPVQEGETLWVFEAGQPCFKSSTHQREVGRPPVFYTRGGDWRGDPSGARPYVHQRPEDWVDDFANYLDRVNAEIEKG